MKNISKVKKQIITLTTSAILLFGSFVPIFDIASNVQAAMHVQEAKIVSAVNFRTAPSLESGKYGVLPRGATVKVLEKVNQYWLKVDYNGKVGYISAREQFVQLEGGQSNNQQAKIIRGVNFRTAPSLNSNRYGIVPRGATVTVLEEVNRHWLKVDYKGRVGYISSQSRFVDYQNGQAPSVEQSPVQENRQQNNDSTSTESWERVAEQVIESGLKLRGAPYRFGARVGSGYYDCSLFTQQVYRDNGIYLPRNSRQQYSYSERIKASEIRKGDLVFFDTKQDGRIDHVAIYMGDDKLLHTYRVGIGVTVSNVSGYWKSRYVGAGRVIK